MISSGPDSLSSLKVNHVSNGDSFFMSFVSKHGSRKKKNRSDWRRYRSYSKRISSSPKRPTIRQGTRCRTKRETSSQTDIPSDINPKLSRDEDESGLDDFVDAQEDIHIPSVCQYERKIKIRMLLREDFVIEVESDNQNLPISVCRSDLERHAVEVVISSNAKGELSATQSVDLSVEYTPTAAGDFEYKENCFLNSSVGVQTVLCHQDTTDTEGQAPSITGSGPPESADEAQDFRTANTSNCASEVKKERPQTFSTVSSIPSDSASTNPSLSLSGLSSLSPTDLPQSYKRMSLVKSKSDSPITSFEVRFEESSDFLNLNKSEGSSSHRENYNTPSPTQSLAGSWFGTKSPTGTYTALAVKGADDYGSLERPITSASDAVQSMHRALKPINDQINEIRNKMICMNIQPLHLQSMDGPTKTQTYHLNAPTLGSAKTNLYLPDPSDFFASISETSLSLVGSQNGIVSEELVIPETFTDCNSFSSSATHLSNFRYSCSKYTGFRGKSMLTGPEDLLEKS